MEGNTRQLFFIKALLNSFAESTKLKVIFAKSMMVPINVPDKKFSIPANTFSYTKGVLPFTYLLSLNLTKPTVDFWPIVSRFERILMSISAYLSQTCHLKLTNAIFSDLLSIAMSTKDSDQAD